MTIYVDELHEYNNKLWCHMATDSHIDQLHKFAQSIGLKRIWFQVHDKVPHYDLTENKRNLAVRKGAIELSAVELFKKCSIKLM